MNWTAFDFVMAGLFAAALIIGLVLIVRIRISRGLKWLLAAGLIVILALFWAQGAVGIF